MESIRFTAQLFYAGSDTLVISFKKDIRKLYPNLIAGNFVDVEIHKILEPPKKLPSENPSDSLSLKNSRFRGKEESNKKMLKDIKENLETTRDKLEELPIIKKKKFILN